MHRPTLALILLSACRNDVLDAETPAMSADVVFTDGGEAQIGISRTLAMAHFAQMPETDRIGTVDISKATIDDLSMAHVRFEQNIEGVRVFGGEGILHLDDIGDLRHVTDSFVRDISVDVTPNYTADEAIDEAVALWDTGWQVLTEDPITELLVMRHEGIDHLVWSVQLEELGETLSPTMPRLFIDAHTGEEVWRYDNLRTGSGASNYSGTVSIDTYSDGTDYYLEDTTRDIGTYTFANTSSSLYYLTDSDDSWTAAPEGVDVHYAAAAAYDYFDTVHGRNSFDGSGGPGYIGSLDGGANVVSLLVNHSTNYNNAYFSGTYFVFGDGDGSNFGPLTSVDIVAHELTHSVNTSAANFTYANESGALDESIADVFAALIEKDLGASSSDIWLIGEDCYTPSTSGDALRYMDDPTADGSSRDHYSSRYTGSADNGGVHYNSGIGNMMFYLLAEGGSHPSGGSMTGIGTDAGGDILYRALTNYMTSSTDFSDARTAMLSAADDLYGTSSTEYAAVEDAWYLVGVGSASGGTGGGGGGTSTFCTGTYDATYTDSLTGAGDVNSEPGGTYYYSSSSGTHEGCLEGDSGTDFDLYLYKWRNGSWRLQSSSTDSGSEESISKTSNRGYFLWQVESYSGSGSYDFNLTTP